MFLNLTFYLLFQGYFEYFEYLLDNLYSSYSANSSSLDIKVIKTECNPIIFSYLKVPDIIIHTEPSLGWFLFGYLQSKTGKNKHE